MANTPPSYMPEAIPTAIGWAHPLTGEQLDCTTGLENPVDFYRPNGRKSAFVDPEGVPTVLCNYIVRGREVIFAFFLKTGSDDILSVTFEPDAGDTPIAVGKTQTIRHVYATDGSYDPEINVTFTVASGLSPITIAVAPTIVIDLTADLPINTVAPVISGTEQVGETLSVTNGTWSAAWAPTSFTYQWWTTTNASPIVGATAATYVLQAADEGADIGCTVTAINVAGSTPIGATAVGPILAA